MSTNLIGQVEFLQNPWAKTKIDWEKFEVTFTETEKLDFLRRSFKDYDNLRISPNIEPNSYEPESIHILDLDGDYDLDILQYRNSQLGEELKVFLNENGKMKYHSKKFGKILSIVKHFKSSPLEILMIECVDSGHLTYFINNLIFLIENNSLKIIKDSTIFYPSDESVYPDKQTINVPFIVTMDTYKLRQSPIIDDVEIKGSYKSGNLIAEFTKGDIGYAYASKEDETGRIWWFVIMENNIKKDWTIYNHCDDKSDNYKNMKVCGWMSSRYLERIE